MTVRDVLVRQNDNNVAGALRSSSRFNEFSRTAIAIAQMATDGLIVPIASFLALGFTIFVLRHEGIHFYLYVLPTAAATVVLVFNLARSGVYDTFLFSTHRTVTRRYGRWFTDCAANGVGLREISETGCECCKTRQIWQKSSVICSTDI
jgi:hypothetical protein